MVPVDDRETLTIGWRIFSDELDPGGKGDPLKVGVEAIDFVGQTKNERDYEESQRYPGDYEAQVSQRPIAIHKMENLASSDRGVIRVRKLIRNAIRALKKDQEPKQHSPTVGNVISTYQQDSIIRAELNEDNQRLYSKSLMKHVLESIGTGEASRRKTLERHCREVLKELD